MPWLWMSVSCLIATVAYVANRPDLYGKRAGRLHRGRALPSALFLVAFRVACALMRLWRRHPAVSRVNSGLLVAGRVEENDVPETVDFVVDLVAEFSEPRALRERKGYRFLPVLDGSTSPCDEAVLALLEELGGPATTVMVHCDSGMGRAPGFAALLPLRRGQADDVAEAISLLERARPFIHLGSADRAFLSRLEPRVTRPPEVLQQTATAS